MPTNDLLICITPTICNMSPYSCFPAEMSIDKVNHRKQKFTLRKRTTYKEIVKPNHEMQLERNMAAPSGPSVKNYEKYTMAPCPSNHGHISCKWYVLTLLEWLFKRLSSPLTCLWYLKRISSFFIVYIRKTKCNRSLSISCDAGN